MMRQNYAVAALSDRSVAVSALWSVFTVRCTQHASVTCRWPPRDRLQLCWLMNANGDCEVLIARFVPTIEVGFY